MFKRILLDKKKNKTISIVITILYFAISVFLITRHEAWRDESQAWTMAKNLTLVELFGVLPTEGHPCLWFLFIMPFAKLGLSFYHFSFISLLVMTIALYLFLEYSPFSLAVKVVVMFSSIFLYYNPVVARIYSLIALIVILLSLFYKNRYDSPVLYGILIALLFQTHVVAFGLAIGLTIDLLIEFFNNRSSRKLIISLGIILFSFICTVLEIMPRSSSPSGIDTSASGMLSKLKPSYIADKLSNFAYTTWGIPEGILTLIVYVLLIAMIVFIFVFITRNRKWNQNYRIIITAVCGVGVFFGILILVYTSHTQMSSILTMILLFVLWQLYENNKESNLKLVCVALLLSVSFLSFIVPQSMLRMDIDGYYSESRLVAGFIEDNIRDDGAVLIENNINDSPVYSYVVSNRKDVKVYDLFNDEEFRFHKMGIEYRDIEISEVIRKAEELSDNEVYYLTYGQKDNDKLQLIYTTSDVSSFINENYYLYKVGAE